MFVRMLAVVLEIYHVNFS